jgi:hypothetical protein
MKHNSEMQSTHLQDLLLGVVLARQVNGPPGAASQIQRCIGVCACQLHAPQQHCLRTPV